MKFFILAVLFCQVAYAAPELKGHPDELKGFLKPDVTVISLTASAEESAYSDKAVVTVLVTTEEKSLSAAMKANTSQRERFTAALVESGIARDKINNAKFSSSPQYGWFGKKPDSYKVVNRMSIEVVSENEFQKVADYADKNEELTFSDVEFEHTKEEEFSQKVKAQALEKVIAKKAFYEKSLNLKLTAISFYEHDVGLHPTAGANHLEEVVVTTARSDSLVSYSKAKLEASGSKSSFDEVKYSASVTVEFKVDSGS